MRRNYSEHELNELTEAVKKGNKPQLVCDGLHFCQDWENNIRQKATLEILELAQTWKYCPWCGKEIIK